MHSSFLVTLTAAALANATCFTGGEQWASQKPYALQQLEYACRLNFANTLFYNGEPETGVCYDIGGGKMVNFNLKYVGDDDTREMDDTECYDGFQKEINGCEYGGASQYTNWRYT